MKRRLFLCSFCFLLIGVSRGFCQDTDRGALLATPDSTVSEAHVIRAIVDEVYGIVTVPRASLVDVPFSEVVNRRLGSMKTIARIAQAPKVLPPRPVVVPKPLKLPHHLQHREIPKAPVVHRAPTVVAKARAIPRRPVSHVPLKPYRAPTIPKPPKQKR